MRPPSVYANRSCPAGCPCDGLRPPPGRHRVGCRLVMILLSHRGGPPAAIAELLGCDPATVRRWIHRYNQEGGTGLGAPPRPPPAGPPPGGGGARPAAARRGGVDAPPSRAAAGPPRHVVADPAPAG